MKTFQTSEELGTYLTARNPRTYGRMSPHPPGTSLFSAISLFIKLADPASTKSDRLIETSGDIGAPESVDRGEKHYGEGLEFLVLVGTPPKGYIIIDWSRFSVSCHNQWGAFVERIYF